MSTKQEHLNGGLVTARDPSMLSDGELQQTDDLFYKPSSPSLHKALGRNTFNITALSAIKGVGVCGFDGATDQVVAYAGTTLYKANLGETGTFASLATSISGDSLETVHYNNRHVLLTGGSANKVLLSDGTTRAHGMEPVVGAPGYSLAGGGTGIFNILGTGYYEYWTTEVYKTSTEEIESTFTGTPVTVNVTSGTATVTLSRPAVANSTATHWRVYRSIKKTNATDVGFPNGFRIAEVPIATLNFVDGGGTTTPFTLPTTVSTLGGEEGTWSNPSNILLDDASTANWSIGAGDPSSDGSIIVGGFGGFSAGNPITNITVRIEAKANAANLARIHVMLSPDGGASYTNKGSTPILTTSLADYDIDLGTWGRTWTAAKLANGEFFVKLQVNTLNNGSDPVAIDKVQVKVTHGGTTADQNTFFRDIQISLGGVSTKIGAAGPPPVASTGDIFQDSLVTNDVENPTQVVFSMPGDIDAFPAVYLLKTDTKDKDIVTNIKSLGSVCLVGLNSQVWRANYLPREEDAEFDRGRCVEVVDTDHGMAGTHAACKFTLAGQTMVGYASSSGLRMTNGFQAITMTDDLDWESLVDISNLSSCILVNDARYHQLRFYYVPNGGSTLSRCLFLSYHPSHLKDGKLKVSGPAHVSTTAVAGGRSSTGERLLYSGDSGGSVYVENRGSTDASGVGIAPILKTREMYLAGPGNEWELLETSVHHQSAGGGTYNMLYEVAKTNTNVRSTSPKPFTTIRRGLSKISAFEAGEGISIKITGTDDGLPASFDYLVLNGKNMGVADPLTR